MITDDYDEKKFLSFSWNLVDLQFKVNKSAEYPGFLILLKRGGKNPIQIWNLENFGKK